VAFERAALWSSARAQQGRDGTRYGDEQILIWRRSYDTRPPALTADDERWPGRDARYADLTPDELPATECPEGHGRTLSPVLDGHHRAGNRFRQAGHHCRARQFHPRADQVPRSSIGQDIVGLNIPTGVPLVYELDHGLQPLRHYYLGDQAAIEAAVKAVAAQGKAGG
jgi:2,3-bisphosphoglycerate-dependent phosphoglycerate mutase